MKEIRVAHLAEQDLDAIWLYIAQRSQSIEIADRTVDTIVDHFSLFAHTPDAGTRRDEIEAGVRGFPVGNYTEIM